MQFKVMLQPNEAHAGNEQPAWVTLGWPACPGPCNMGQVVPHNQGFVVVLATLAF
jgi:hypothetical protein